MWEVSLVETVFAQFFLLRSILMLITFFKSQLLREMLMICQLFFENRSAVALPMPLLAPDITK